MTEIEVFFGLPVRVINAMRPGSCGTAAPGIHSVVSDESCFFFSSRRRHTRFDCDWSSDVCSSDLQPMDKVSEAILALKPVTFRYKHELDSHGIPQFGLVAEQVEKVNPDLVARDDQEIGRASCRERV